MKAVLKNFAVAVLAAAGAMALLLIVLALAGYPAWAIMQAWIRGAVGSPFDIATSIKEACPLLLTGLAAGLAFRAGALNIGGEGQFMMGAIATIALTTRWAPPGPAWWVMMVAFVGGALAGALWALIAALLDRYRGVPLVLSTILLNFVALSAVGMLITGPLGSGRETTSFRVPDAFWLPVLMPRTSLHAGVLLALVLAAAAWIVQQRTRFGFEVRVTGLAPLAAALAGIPTRSRAVQVMLLSGALAGLGGALQVLGVTHQVDVAAPGYGYAGVAVALLGRLDPAGIVLSALFFGMLSWGAQGLQKEGLGVSHGIADVAKGVILLLMLVLGQWAARRRGRVKDKPSAKEGR